MSEIVCNKPLTGRISGRSSLQGTMSVRGSYEGEYSVTPTADRKVVLKTANKNMTKDVVVNPLPYFEFANEYGGITAIIG